MYLLKIAGLFVHLRLSTVFLAFIHWSTIS